MLRRVESLVETYVWLENFRECDLFMFIHRSLDCSAQSPTALYNEDGEPEVTTSTMIIELELWQRSGDKP